MKCPSTFNCPVEATLDLIGGKYKSLIQIGRAHV